MFLGTNAGVPPFGPSRNVVSHCQPTPPLPRAMFGEASDPRLTGAVHPGGRADGTAPSNTELAAQAAADPPAGPPGDA
jgi:hypothetical protein